MPVYNFYIVEFSYFDKYSKKIVEKKILVFASDFGKVEEIVKEYYKKETNDKIHFKTIKYTGIKTFLKEK